MSTGTAWRDISGDTTDADLARLLELREQLLRERANAASPAVARSLEMADIYLFMALGYLGYSEQLFPEERIGNGGGGSLIC